MTTRRAFLGTALGGATSGLLAGAASAQAAPVCEAVGREVRLPNTDCFDITSGINGVTYRIKVSCPDSDADKQAAYPVIFLLDGTDYFETVASMAAWLAEAGECQPVSVVGVCYPVGSSAETVRPRFRDFTWVSDSAHDQFVRMLTGDATPVDMAGGEKFLRFLEEELKPRIAGCFPADVGNNALFCHSLGGLFGLEVLLREPSCFQRYAISSAPVLWADSDILRTEDHYAATHEDLRAKLLLSAGSLETTLEHVLQLPASVAEEQDAFVTALGRPNPLAQLSEFHDRLAARHYAGLDMTFEVFSGESHTSVAGVAFLRGMRTLFTGNAPATLPPAGGELPHSPDKPE